MPKSPLEGSKSREEREFSRTTPECSTISGQLSDISGGGPTCRSAARCWCRVMEQCVRALKQVLKSSTNRGKWPIERRRKAASRAVLLDIELTEVCCNAEWGGCVDFVGGEQKRVVWDK